MSDIIQFPSNNDTADAVETLENAKEYLEGGIAVVVGEDIDGMVHVISSTEDALEILSLLTQAIDAIEQNTDARLEMLELGDDLPKH
jgi:hypothetical protein